MRLTLCYMSTINTQIPMQQKAQGQHSLTRLGGICSKSYLFCFLNILNVYPFIFFWMFMWSFHLCVDKEHTEHWWFNHSNVDLLEHMIWCFHIIFQWWMLLITKTKKNALFDVADEWTCTMMWCSWTHAQMFRILSIMLVLCSVLKQTYSLCQHNPPRQTLCPDYRFM